MYNFETQRVWGIFVRVDNQAYVAGSVYLFKLNGICLYHYHREAPPEDWALKRVWNFGLFGLVHIGPGKSTSLPGWHIIFPGFSFKKSPGHAEFNWWSIRGYDSITLTWQQRLKRWLGGRQFRISKNNSHR